MKRLKAKSGGYDNAPQMSLFLITVELTFGPTQEGHREKWYINMSNVKTN